MPRSVPRNSYMVAIVFLTFFVMSLLTNVLRHYQHQQLQGHPGGCSFLAVLLLYLPME